MLGCLSECLQNSINSNKQTYLQSEPPSLCAGFGFLETRMEKNKKAGGGNQLCIGLLVTNQGSHKKSYFYRIPLPFPRATSRQGGHSKVSEHKQPVLSELSMDRPLSASGTH